MGIRLYRVEKIEYADACTLAMDGEKMWDLMVEYAGYTEENGFEIHLETLKAMVNLDIECLSNELEPDEIEKVREVIKNTPDYIIENLKKDIAVEEEKGNEYILYKSF
jgi:hypothetical protein